MNASIRFVESHEYLTRMFSRRNGAIWTEQKVNSLKLHASLGQVYTHPGWFSRKFLAKDWGEPFGLRTHVVGFVEYPSSSSRVIREWECSFLEIRRFDRERANFQKKSLGSKIFRNVPVWSPNLTSVSPKASKQEAISEASVFSLSTSYFNYDISSIYTPLQISPLYFMIWVWGN